jgi:hypothetical protein
MSGLTAGDHKYTFLTVAHAADYRLLWLQARSLNRYLDRDLLGEIVVIQNNPQLSRLRGWRHAMLREYGSLAPAVRFVDVRQIADVPPYISGWFSQQILKLMAARIVETKRYVVLDAKNHLVFPLTRRCIETSSGTMLLHPMNYEHHDMRPFLANTLDYFGLNLRDHVKCFLPTTTPFPLSTDTVRDLVDYIEVREKRPFPEAFVYDGFKRTEFFLLGAYLLATGRRFAEFYDLSGQGWATVWPEDTAEDIRKKIAWCENNATAVFAVHRRAIPQLDEATRHVIAAFWQQRYLFRTVDSPLRFLREFNRPSAPVWVRIRRGTAAAHRSLFRH